MRFVLPPDVFPRGFVILCYWALSLGSIWANALHEGMNMKVFIADDSRVVVERLAGLLDEVPGARLVGQAGNVPAAVNGIQKMKPDAVILDLHMPGGSGLDVLRAIRSDHPDLYVLICTNYPYPEYREECLAAGANLFLDKSADFEKIPSILRELAQKEAKISSGAR
jgi:DNA-binding NarL/FixJ family response regulator